MINKACLSRVFAVAMIILGAAPVWAQQTSVMFDLPAQSLSDALSTVGKLTDTNILINRELVDGRNAPALKAQMTVSEALAKLLQGTGLTPRFVDDKTVVLAAGSADVRTDSSVSGVLLAQSSASPVTEEGAAKGADEDESRIQEIIVTATKRAERIQDVPMSITAITAEDISQRGLVSAEDYLRGIPGVNQVGEPFSQAIIIRGIETTTTTQNFGVGPTVATYFGETPTTTSAGLQGSNVDIKLVDIERVEVLRGPQGTAFGNSSMGGAVRTIPVAPKLDHFEGKVAANYSVTSGTGGDNYNIQVVGNLPLIKDKLAVRAVGYQYEDSGFYKNRAGSDAAFRASLVNPITGDPHLPGGQLDAFAVDEDEVGSYYVRGGRIAALWQATGDLRFTASYLTQDIETDGYGVASSGSYEQSILRIAPQQVRRGHEEGVSDYYIDISNAVMEYDLGWANLLATYSYVEGGTSWALPLTAFGIPWPASFATILDHREHVGEIRLATNLDGSWNFLAGLYADKSDDEYRTPEYLWYGDDPATNPNCIPLASTCPDFLGSYWDRRNQKQKAGFAEVSWGFLPNWTLTGGVRAYQYDRRIRIETNGAFFGPGSQLNDDDASGSNFRGNLSYKPGDNALLYAAWAQGFRLGKPQPAAPSSLCDTDSDGFIDGTNVTIASTGKVESDAVDSYEFGGKFVLMDRRVTIDAALFRMEWSDIPVSVGVPACRWVYTANAGAALSEGAELQANIQISDAFRVDFGGSWTHARLTEDVPAQGFSDGDRLPGSPEFNGNLSLQYSFNIGRHNALVRADSIYVGAFYGDMLQTPGSRSGDYVKFDTTARVSIDKLDIDLYVRNLTNEDAFTFRGPGGGSSSFFGYQLRPRTIGLQVGYSFSD